MVPKDVRIFWIKINFSFYSLLSLPNVIWLSKVPWTARRSIQSILKEINPEYSLEELMLKLKLQYFGYLMWRTDSLEKTLMLGKTEGGRRRGRLRMRWLDGITDSMDMGWVDSGSWWWTGRPGVLRFLGLQRVWHNWATELTELKAALSHRNVIWASYAILNILLAT